MKYSGRMSFLIKCHLMKSTHRDVFDIPALIAQTNSKFASTDVFNHFDDYNRAQSLRVACQASVRAE